MPPTQRNYSIERQDVIGSLPVLQYIYIGPFGGRWLMADAERRGDVWVRVPFGDPSAGARFFIWREPTPDGTAEEAAAPRGRRPTVDRKARERAVRLGRFEKTRCAMFLFGLEPAGQPIDGGAASYDLQFDRQFERAQPVLAPEGIEQDPHRTLRQLLGGGADTAP